MLAIRRALFHAAERRGRKPEFTPPTWIKNGWRWHLVCQKPTCQGGSWGRWPQKIGSLTFWHLVCQKHFGKYSCKRRLPLRRRIVVKQIKASPNMAEADLAIVRIAPES